MVGSLKAKSLTNMACLSRVFMCEYGGRGGAEVLLKRVVKYLEILSVSE